MRPTVSLLSRLAVGITFGLSLGMIASAGTPQAKLQDKIQHIEERLDARVGVVLLNMRSSETWSHRPDERFSMNSIAKVPICAAILAQKDQGHLSLSERLLIREGDVLSYAPVTSERVGGSMTVDALCLAALDMSDNTASNLLLDRVGGPAAVTSLFRLAGDPVSRLDRREPDLNTFATDDPRDTTTPVAMAKTLEHLLTGDILSLASRNQLAEWMRHGAVTTDLLRAHAPAEWVIFDKSGSGDQTRNIVAIISPKDKAPWVATIFISDADADFETRNAALKDLSAAVMAVIRN